MSARAKRRHLLFSIFIVVIPCLVLLVALYKVSFFTVHRRYAYAKIKISQGLWWASTEKPSAWMLDSIQAGDKSYDLFGNLQAEVLSVRSYPAPQQISYPVDNYDIYVEAKLAVTYDRRKHLYYFDRNVLSIGSPIEIQTGRSDINGTVIELSDKELQDLYVDKTVILTKRMAYSWEYNAIPIGDSYFDGVNQVFQVLEKSQTPTSQIVQDMYGNLLSGTVTSTSYITIKARIKVLDKNGQFYFGEERLLTAGNPIDLTTAHYNYKDFVVASIY